jgi:hypothetical protein
MQKDSILVGFEDGRGGEGRNLVHPGVTRTPQARLGSCITRRLSFLYGSFGARLKKQIKLFDMGDRRRTVEDQGVLDRKRKWGGMPEATAKNSRVPMSWRNLLLKGPMTTVISSSTASGGEVDSSQANKATLNRSQSLNHPDDRPATP